MIDQGRAPATLQELAERLQSVQDERHAIGLGLSPAQVRATLALNATVLFLSEQPGFAGTGALTPLWSLLTALGDLESGKPSPLFNILPASHRPPDATEDQLQIAFAATGMDALIRFGSRSKDMAAAEMAELLRKEGYRPGNSRSNADLATMIAGWRDRLSTGKKVPPFALQAWTLYKKETSQACDMDVAGWLNFIRAHLADRRNLNNPAS